MSELPDELARFLAQHDPNDLLTVRTILRVAGVETPSQDEPESVRDLTVEDVAEEVSRAASTVRGWLNSGELDGYKLNGRDWRVPRDSLRQYLQGQRKGSQTENTNTEVRLDSWRDHVDEGAA